MRQQHNSWFQFVADQNDLSPVERAVVEAQGDFLLNAVESTAMTKCFKMVLLKAFLELDGFTKPPTTNTLAETSWRLLKRHPNLYEKDLPASRKLLAGGCNEWHTYWKGNPIKFYSNKKNAPFRLDGNRFVCQSRVKPEYLLTFSHMVYELVELRLEEYSLR